MCISYLSSKFFVGSLFRLLIVTTRTIISKVMTSAPPPTDSPITNLWFFGRVCLTVKTNTTINYEHLQIQQTCIWIYVYMNQNLSDATGGTGTADDFSGECEFTASFSGVPVVQCLDNWVIFSRSLFVLLIFLLPLFYLSLTRATSGTVLS